MILPPPPYLLLRPKPPIFTPTIPYFCIRCPLLMSQLSLLLHSLALSLHNLILQRLCVFYALSLFSIFPALRCISEYFMCILCTFLTQSFQLWGVFPLHWDEALHIKLQNASGNSKNFQHPLNLCFKKGIHQNIIPNNKFWPWLFVKYIFTVNFPKGSRILKHVKEACKGSWGNIDCLVIWDIIFFCFRKNIMGCSLNQKCVKVVNDFQQLSHKCILWRKKLARV